MFLELLSFSFFSVTGWGIDLDYHDIEYFALEMNRDNSVVFEIASKWKILKEMGIPDYLTCLLRNLYAGQEATVRTGHGATDWFQIGKGVRQGCILSPCLFNLDAEYIMRMLGWKKHKLESRLLGEISITSDMQVIPPLWQKVKRN